MNTTTSSTTKIPTYRGAAAGEIEAFAMANCRLMLLSSQNAAVSSVTGEQVGRMFDCKTCGRKFPSFQALGGHRASHKKAKLQNSGEFPDEESNIPAKAKIHACRICGVEFPIGQALGGHMRRHRELLLEGNNNKNYNDDVDNTVVMMTSAAASGVTSEGSFGNSEANNNNCGGEKRKNNVDDEEEVAVKKQVDDVPVMRKSSSCKRVKLDLDLDLSLWWKKEQIDEYNCDRKVEDDDYEKDNLKLDLGLATH